MNKFITITKFQCLSLLLLLSGSSIAWADEYPDLAGVWLFNESMSDSTDKQVEKSLREAGGKVKRGWFSRDKEKYRGGPPEQELYDRISYDRKLEIKLNDSDFYTFTYADEFERKVYTDNRSRSVSLTGLAQVDDFSFAHWENAVLHVEARPRDGGFAQETYRLSNDGMQLTVDMYIKPRTFEVPIEVSRTFDRQAAD